MSALLQLALACDLSPSAADSGPAPEVAPCGSWASVGQPFALSWCTSCHSSGLVGDERFGAPEAVNLDTLHDLRTWSSEVSRRALDDTPDMPPTGGVPASERDAVATWIACGAPGDESPFPVGERDANLRGAFTLTGAIEAEGDERRLIQEVGDSPFLTQRFVVDDAGRGALSGFTRFDGDVDVALAEFSPPLAIYDESTDALSSTPSVAWTTDAGQTTSVEAWTVTREVDTAPDPRFMDQAPSRVVAEREGEPAFIWWFSSTRMLVAQAQLESDGTWLTILNTAPAAQRSGAPGFPLDEGGSWASRATWLGSEP